MLREIDRKLLETWRRERSLFHARGWCHLAMWVVGLFLFDLVSDWSFGLPGPARLVLLASNLAILAWVGYHQWWAALRRYDPLRVSLAVERLNPDLKNLLVSYVQLDLGRDDPSRASRQLIEAVRQEAVRQAEPLDFLAVVDFRRIRNLLLATAVVLLAFTLSGAFAAEFYRVLAIRLADPNSSLGYPTRTQILEETGDQSVQQGKPLRLSLTAGGEVPDEALLQIRYGDGPWEKVRLPVDEDDTFTYDVKQCSGSFVYRFRVGDAVSPRYYTVEVVPAPQIVQSIVTLRYPKYANQ
ncbi:MAG: hypothetical protein MUF06_12240, partial [Pirellulaceae bacterium]|nr:hypothetical protein [Pirellulaceae bacterium]